MIGRRLSHYEIVEEIGRGGMGVVYRAVDVNLGREVALKVLPDELVHDPVRRERLLHEAHFMNLERFAEGIKQSEELLRRGTSNPTSYENLAQMLTQSGDLKRARDVIDEFVRRHPDSAVSLRMQGEMAAREGRFAEAQSFYDKALTVDPQNLLALLGKRAVSTLQEHWAETRRVDAAMISAQNPFLRFLGVFGDGHLAAVAGRGEESLRDWEQAARVDGLPPFQRSMARNRLATTHLRGGRPALALKEAEMALVDARDRDSEFESLQLLAIAQAGVGRTSEAENTVTLLATRAKILPSDRELRRIHWAKGEIALLAGDTGTAVAELNTAQKMLPVHGPFLGPPTSHPDLWFDAALANIKGGQDGDAARLLERLQSGHERMFAMDAYARSYYLLGQIYERQGNKARARDQYRRFVELWRDGDLERGWVAEARKKLERLTP